ncbi:rod-determining factor RdfA [Halobaculum sp. MBLA0147]|uniref:rod-determining factor RdfA n=1 Tax=Halobaculum sp. MBLA0147 TaxID=3079934 RepID=UPI003526B5E5
MKISNATAGCCKVDRVVSAVEGLPSLEAVNRDLQQRFTGVHPDRDDGMGVRRIAEYLNKWTLKTLVGSTGGDVHQPDIETLYTDLTTQREPVSPESAGLLNRAGLSAERAREYLVSHTTVHKHLRDHIEVDTRSANRAAPRERTNELKDEMAQKIAYHINGGTDLGPPDEEIEVNVSVSLECPACGTSTNADRVFARGSLCDCEE